MKTINEIAHTSAWQIYEEIGISKHSIERIEEIISDILTEQEEIDHQQFKVYLENNRTNYPDFMNGTDSYAFGMREGYTMAFDKIISNIFNKE